MCTFTMEHFEKKALIDNTVFMCENLALSSMLMDQLVSLEVLTMEMREEIEARPYRQQKVQELLRMLPQRGLRALHHFFVALIESKQRFIAERISNSLSKQVVTGGINLDESLTPLTSTPIKRATRVECDCACDAMTTHLCDGEKQIALLARMQGHDVNNAPRRAGQVSRMGLMPLSPPIMESLSYHLCLTSNGVLRDDSETEAFTTHDDDDDEIVELEEEQMSRDETGMSSTTVAELASRPQGIM